MQRDVVLVVFVVYSFSFAIYTQATGISSEVHNASIAFVNEDRSILSDLIISAFYPPRFKVPQLIDADKVDRAMDEGLYMFVVNIPSGFEADIRAGRRPEIQVNIDATAMQQAGIGAGYIHGILTNEITRYVQRSDATTPAPVRIVTRMAFNPNRNTSWFNSIVAIINQVTMLTIILTGAALLREREHGTIEHLLVMPLTSFEIAMAKVWANGLVILVAVVLSLGIVVEMALGVPVAGSRLLFFAGTVLYLFFATALGIFLGTVAGSMGQFSLLILLVMMPMQMLSGGQTPVESQPDWLQYITFFPSRHFVSFSQAIIYRGAGLEIVWPEFLAVTGLGLVLFLFSLALFRRSVAVSK